MLTRMPSLQGWWREGSGTAARSATKKNSNCTSRNVATLFVQRKASSRHVAMKRRIWSVAVPELHPGVSPRIALRSAYVYLLTARNYDSQLGRAPRLLSTKRREGLFTLCRVAGCSG